MSVMPPLSHLHGWTRRFMDKQIGKKSFSYPINLSTNGSDKMESFLRISTQETVCPQLQTAFGPEGPVDHG